jgi:hypothetical protein
MGERRVLEVEADGAGRSILKKLSAIRTASVV